MPSVTAGLGYNFSKNDEGADMIWIRPKIYWDLGFRGLAPALLGLANRIYTQL